MGRRGGLIAVLAVAGSLAVGCGDGGGEAPEFEGGDEEQVAATVRVVADAMEAGDGEEACPLITERGQRELVRIVNAAPSGPDVSTCEEAVGALPRSRFEPGEVDPSPDRVHLSEGNPDFAEMDCRDPSGAYLLRRIEGEWRVNHAYCVH